MSVPITGIYVGLTIILAIILGTRIGFYRAKVGISILHGDNMDVAQRMRVHGNLLETAALTLLALGVIELGGARTSLLHGLGIAYIAARICHAIGLKHDNIRHPLRAIGAMGSTLVMLIAGIIAIWQGVQIYL